MPNPVDIRAEALIFESLQGAHLFLADGSRVFDIDVEFAATLSHMIDNGKVPRELAELIGDGESRFIGSETVAPPDVRSISLNVAQSCNMSCSYCYADEGRFGGRARLMEKDIARRAIDRLVLDAPAGSNLLVGFMGGEPFLNRKVIHWATHYASTAAERKGHRIRFSVTTNATLLNEDDAVLLASYPFSVAVSLDGNQWQNDRQRKIRKSAGSAYDAALIGVERLTGKNRPAHLSVRATITPLSGALLPILDHLLSIGVDEAGFAPVVSAPAGSPAFSAASLSGFLEQMVECGSKAKTESLAGRAYPFSNFHTAMQEIHRGAHMPYPCGAGAGYLSVNTEGGLYACHRLIDDPEFAFGSIDNGTDDAARASHLTMRHVDKQEPCRSCWARYLCGGGCYHEVTRRGRIGCDYIRGWLKFCLSAYAELSHRSPSYFDRNARYQSTGV